MPTLEDVAARAGVSRGTASRAVAGHPNVAAPTRERVLAAAAALGYLPDRSARALAGGGGDRVAVVSLVHPWSPPTDPFLASVVTGAAEVAADLGLGVVLRRLPVRDRSGLAGLAADRRLAGVLLVNPTPEALDALPAGLRARTVTLGRSRADVASVDMDNTGGATTALRHLLGSGRRSVPVMAGPSSMPCAAERIAAYLQLMHEAGLRPRVIRSAPRRPEAARAFAAAVGTEKPDAVLATHEEQGHAVLAVCAARGWDGVEVVSFDDFPAPPGTRGYTSLDSVTPELGAAGVRMVAAGPRPGDHPVVPVRLLA